eukprot:590674-Prymnesium_polylepis.2
MLLHNVSVCDLGAGTIALRYKGERHERPSLPCVRVDHASAHGDGPRRNDTERAAARPIVSRGARPHTHAHRPPPHSLADTRTGPAASCARGSACCRRHPSVPGCRAQKGRGGEG